MAYSNSTPVTDTSPRVTSHSVHITGLAPGTIYHYRVKSKDAAGNPSVSADFTFTTAAAMSLLSGIVSYWKMESTALLDSAGPNPLTLGGAATIVGGKIGNALDGAGGSAYSPTSTGIDFSTSCTFTCWFKGAGINASNFAALVAKGDAGTPANCEIYLTWDQTAGGWKCSWGPAAPYTLVLPFTMDMTGTVWVFFCFRYDAAAGKITLSYNDPTVNSISATSVTAPTHFPGVGLMFSDLAYSGTLYGSPGVLDESGFWSRALSDAEVNALYNGGAGLSYPF